MTDNIFKKIDDDFLKKLILNNDPNQIIQFPNEIVMTHDFNLSMFFLKKVEESISEHMITEIPNYQFLCH